MTPTLGEGSLWGLEPFLEPLDSLHDPACCTLVYDGTLLLDQDTSLLPDESTAALPGELAAGDEHSVPAGDPCQSTDTAAILQSLVPGVLPTVQPLVPAAQGAVLAGMMPRCEWNDLTDLPSLGSASSGASGHAVLEPSIGALPAFTHSGTELKLQPPPPQQQRQPRGKGRPRIDRSQMTDKQLKAIKNAQNNHERKKNHMRDLEEKVVDMRAQLEREQAYQENSERSIAALERLLDYRSEMIAVLGQHGKEAGCASSAPGLAIPPSNELHEAGSIGSSVAPTWEPQTLGLPLLQEGAPGGAGRVKQLAQPGHPMDGAAAASCTATWDACRCRPHSGPSSSPCSRGRQRLAPGNTLLHVPMPISRLAESWVQKLPATWRFVQDALQVQLPALKAGVCVSPGPYLPAGALLLRQQKQQQRPLHLHEQWQPMPGSCWAYLAGHGVDTMAAISATASPAVVAEIKSMSAADMIDGWRDVARHARDVLSEYDVTHNEARAISQLRPHVDRLASVPFPLPANWKIPTLDLGLIACRGYSEAMFASLYVMLSCMDVQARMVVKLLYDPGYAQSPVAMGSTGWLLAVPCSRELVAGGDMALCGVPLQAVLLNLAMVHNPALMKHLYISSAGSLPEAQHRETYAALVGAMEVTPSQQERYLQLADAYATFVQRARQHKAEALARIQRSSHTSSSTPAGLGRMSSQYLEAVEGAAMLSAYPDAEFAAINHLSKGMAKIYRPLQKARAAAMAYPQFLDLLTMIDAIKRLPPPEQRRQQLGET